MASLWDDDNESSGKSNENPSQELIQQEPSAIISLFNQQKITSETDALFTALVSCETIVLAAHAIADHVPILATEEAKQFWKTSVSLIFEDCLELCLDFILI